MKSLRALSRSEVRELDRRAIEEFGVPGVILMENAGRGAAELLTHLDPQLQRVTILCGPGNNGGDGYVMARHLQNLGVSVHLWMHTAPKPGSDADINYQIWKHSGPVNQVVSGQTIDFGTGWIIDALFGTGLDRPLGTPFDAIVNQINASGNSVLAVDIPSGLDCDSGKAMPPTVRATHTATFVSWKKGFLEPTAKPWLGEVHVIGIGAPRNLIDQFLGST